MTNDLKFEQNANGVYVPSQPATKLRSFYGRVIDKMPKLLSGKDIEGKVVDVPREPMTPKQLVTERVNGQNQNDKQLLINNYVFTAYAVIPDPDSDEVILVPKSNPMVAELIRGLNPKSNLTNGALDVDTEKYQAIKADKNSLTLSEDIANGFRKSPYSQEKARQGAWDNMLEGDSKLRADNLKLVQKIKGGSMKDRMGLWLPSTEYKGLRLLVVGSVGDGYSVAIGDYYLDIGNGRLVGVAPEAQSRENGSLEAQVLAIAKTYLGEKPLAEFKEELIQLYAQNRQ